MSRHFVAFRDFQIFCRLDARKTLGPNSRSFTNIQIVNRVAKIGFGPVSRLWDPFIAREERSIYDHNAADLQDPGLRRGLDLGSDFFQSRVHLVE